MMHKNRHNLVFNKELGTGIGMSTIIRHIIMYVHNYITISIDMNYNGCMYMLVFILK